MREQSDRNPYMDYRNVVPFMDLSGYIVKQPHALEEFPATDLRMQLFKKRFSGMVNIRRMRYKMMCEAYRNGRK